MGMGVSHGPTVVLPAQMWAERAATEVHGTERNLNTLDGRFLTYAELLAERGEPFAREATLGNFQLQFAQCQRALDRLADDLATARPDVLVVIGSDQDELYRDGNVPAFAVYHGGEIATWKRDQTGYPAWRRAVTAAYGMDEVHRYPGSPALARQLVEQLVGAGFDVAASDAVPDPIRAGFGHAWGFVAERLFRDTPIPMIPVLINGFRPPNVPTPRRCYELGFALRRAIEASPLDARVAVMASGGLSHMLCEETLDRSVIDALLSGEHEPLCALPPHSLQSGSSEIRSWIALAAATSHLKPDWLEYVPVYRTPAGSGMGCAFASWNTSTTS